MPVGVGLVSKRATEAAYGNGMEWLEQLLDYINKNYEFLKSSLQHDSSSIKVTPLEGTYLAWLDFKELGLSEDQLQNMLLKNAKVWLDEGPKFGGGGEGFRRINLACPRVILENAVERIAGAINYD